MQGLWVTRLRMCQHGRTSPVSVSTQECIPPADTCLIRSPGTQAVGSTTSLPTHTLERQVCRPTDHTSGPAPALVAHCVHDMGTWYPCRVVTLQHRVSDKDPARCPAYGRSCCLHTGQPTPRGTGRTRCLPRHTPGLQSPAPGSASRRWRSAGSQRPSAQLSAAASSRHICIRAAKPLSQGFCLSGAIGEGRLLPGVGLGSTPVPVPKGSPRVPAPGQDLAIAVDGHSASAATHLQSSAPLACHDNQ